MLRVLTISTAVTVAAFGTAGVASAHTEPDYVAVPAGSEAGVNLKPTHGCGDSPTVSVRVRSPLPAQAGEVEGWTATTTPDRDGRTILEWTGGVLPADEEGAFPIEFLVPDAPGDLLTFPSVQRCENGEELAWLSGDPEAEYPAPRVLILPAGFEPALTIDDVPADVPGREKLTAVVDVDQPNTPPTVPTTTVAATTAAPTTAAPTTVARTTAATTTPATTTPVTTAASTSPATPATTATPDTSPTTSAASDTTAADGDDSDSSTVAVLVIVAVIAAVAVASAAVIVARRRASGEGG